MTTNQGRINAWSMTEPIEAGSSNDDSRILRRCLGQFATGVTVMTGMAEGVPFGMTVNSFSALSLDPALVLWSVRCESASLALFEQADHFGVSVLAVDQVSVSAKFATPGPSKFQEIDWTAGQSGVPLLHHVVAHLECRLTRTIEAGDHVILIGEVERYARYTGEPLVFSQGRYAITHEHPDALINEIQIQSPQGPADAADWSLPRLLHYASHQVSSGFDVERQKERLTFTQLRIIGSLRTGPRTLEEIWRLAYLGKVDANDAVEAMLDAGEVQRDSEGVLSLTASGRQRADSIVRRARAFESILLKGLSPSELAVARRVLTLVGARAADERGKKSPSEEAK